jgi:hypothetical protein
MVTGLDWFLIRTKLDAWKSALPISAYRRRMFFAGLYARKSSMSRMWLKAVRKEFRHDGGTGLSPGQSGRFSGWS